MLNLQMRQYIIIEILLIKAFPGCDKKIQSPACGCDMKLLNSADVAAICASSVLTCSASNTIL
jgi:hypothetical protein